MKRKKQREREREERKRKKEKEKLAPYTIYKITSSSKYIKDINVKTKTVTLKRKQGKFSILDLAMVS